MAKESAGQSVSRNQLVIIGALFVVLLGVVYFLFLKGGDEEAAPEAAPAPAPATAPETEEDEKEAPAPKKKAKGPVETSEVFGGKDPFEPVVDVKAGSGGEGGEATDTATTDTSTTDTSTTDTSTTTTPTAPTAPSDDDDADVVKTGYRIKLLEVYTDEGVRKALVQTTKRETRTSKLHKLVEGQRFRGVFKLTSLNNRCGSFLHGNDWFALCEGQRTIRK